MNLSELKKKEITKVSSLMPLLKHGGGGKEVKSEGKREDDEDDDDEQKWEIRKGKYSAKMSHDSKRTIRKGNDVRKSPFENVIKNFLIASCFLGFFFSVIELLKRGTDFGMG